MNLLMDAQMENVSPALLNARKTGPFPPGMNMIPLEIRFLQPGPMLMKIHFGFPQNILIMRQGFIIMAKRHYSPCLGRWLTKGSHRRAGAGLICMRMS